VLDERVLDVADPLDLGCGRMHVTRGQEILDPVLAWLAVDVGVVVRLGERISLVLERPLPRLRVYGSGVRQDAVEIEQQGGDAAW